MVSRICDAQVLSLRIVGKHSCFAKRIVKKSHVAFIVVVKIVGIGKSRRGYHVRKIPVFTNPVFQPGKRCFPACRIYDLFWIAGPGGAVIVSCSLCRSLMPGGKHGMHQGHFLNGVCRDLCFISKRSLLRCGIFNSNNHFGLCIDHIPGLFAKGIFYCGKHIGNICNLPCIAECVGLFDNSGLFIIIVSQNGVSFCNSSRVFDLCQQPCAVVINVFVNILPGFTPSVGKARQSIFPVIKQSVIV